MPDYQALFFTVEDLHPDLQPYFAKLPNGWPALRHPLVYSVPHLPNLNSLCNQTYAAKKEQLDSALQDGDMSQFVVLYERPYRLHAIQEWLRAQPLAAGQEGAKTYWETVSWAWTDSENIHEDPDGWTRLWLEPPLDYAQWRHLAMREKDRQAFEALPDRVEIFHGEERDGEVGASWTTSLEVAQWFASRFGRDGVVYRGEVDKGDIVAYLGGRSEAEVIVDPDVVDHEELEGGQLCQGGHLRARVLGLG